MTVARFETSPTFGTLFEGRTGSSALALPVYVCPINYQLGGKLGTDRTAALRSGGTSCVVVVDANRSSDELTCAGSCFSPGRNPQLSPTFTHTSTHTQHEVVISLGTSAYRHWYLNFIERADVSRSYTQPSLPPQSSGSRPTSSFSRPLPAGSDRSGVKSPSAYPPWSITSQTQISELSSTSDDLNLFSTSSHADVANTLRLPPLVLERHSIALKKPPAILSLWVKASQASATS